MRRPLFEKYRVVSRCRPAFTLVELTVCILFIAIIAAIAIPKYSSGLSGFRVESAAKRIAQDIALAQRSARQTNSSRTITISVTTDEYSLPELVSMDRSTDKYVVKLRDDPYASDLISIVDSTRPSESPTSVTLTFDRFGTPDRGITLKLSSGDQLRWVTVHSTSGKATVQ